MLHGDRLDPLTAGRELLLAELRQLQTHWRTASYIVDEQPVPHIPDPIVAHWKACYRAWLDHCRR